jgi:hypothetical protein
MFASLAKQHLQRLAALPTDDMRQARLLRIQFGGVAFGVALARAIRKVLTAKSRSSREWT